MKRVLFVFLLIVCSTNVMATNDDVLNSAKTWLSLVDSEKYDESWDTSASFLKKQVPMQQWDSILSSARDPLGQIHQREIKNIIPQTTLPGVPTGEYNIVVFQSAFENKSSVAEVVTVSLENGEWRVVGYVIN